MCLNMSMQFLQVKESLLPKWRSSSNSKDSSSLEGYAACKDEICQAVSYCLVTGIRQSIASNMGGRHEQMSEPRSNETTPCPVRTQTARKLPGTQIGPVQASISPVFNFDSFQLSPAVYARAHTPPENLLCPAAKATSKNICVRPVATDL
ncbi:hypothetical protein K0M31_017984 [Melipona bicolor]|uniref:Uncharacterized protein n=1 Tax=Melipona bicolor TaxID=60889 RepID=A0AA40KEA6_9HYME|nr:hypothetical protein K0M31_017984 [Melipona bicolor]